MQRLVTVYFLLLIFIVCPQNLKGFLHRIPSAGVVERELEREYESIPLTLEEEPPPVLINIPEEKLDFPDGKKVLITSVEIRGNQSIPEDIIVFWIEECINKELSIKDIYGICHLIDQHYAQAGFFLTSAYPPPQTIENNCLVIEILEGCLGTVRMEGNCFYSDAFIHSYFVHLENHPLRYDEFLRAILLLNENMDMTVGAVFEKGEEVGTADIILRVVDCYPAHLYLNANNYGMNLTTNTRVGGRLDWGSFVVYGDKLSFAQVVGCPVNALDFSDITYTLPLNRNGLSLEGAYLFSKFKIEELSRLHLRGSSSIATLKTNYAWLRSRCLNIDVFSWFDYKQIKNFVFNHCSSFDRLRILGIGADFDYFRSGICRDHLILRMAGGIPNVLGGLKYNAKHSSRKHAGGQFIKFNFDFDHLQFLRPCEFFYFHASGQWSPNRLTLPEQIYIGGDTTVRGYPLAEALGDSGYYLNFEYRFPLPFVANNYCNMVGKPWNEVFQFDLFLDQGGVFFKERKNVFLCGTGLGVRINGPYNLTFSIDVGFPLIHHHDRRTAFCYIKLTGQAF